MNDLKGQLEPMQKMGGMAGIMSMMPGMGKLSKQLDASGFDDKAVRRQIALIQSMTSEERRRPDILKASRKTRIAKGAGQEVQELNRLLKMHRQMADMMKKMGKRGMRGMMDRMMGGGMPSPGPGGGGAALPPPGGFPGMGGGAQALPPGLSGFGKKK